MDRAIKAIHGDDGNLHYISPSYKSVWTDIVASMNHLNSKGVKLLSFCKRLVGNRESTLFWKDTWSENAPLWSRFSRLFSQK